MSDEVIREGSSGNGPGRITILSTISLILIMSFLSFSALAQLKSYTVKDATINERPAKEIVLTNQLTPVPTTNQNTHVSILNHRGSIKIGLYYTETVTYNVTESTGYKCNIKKHIHPNGTSYETYETCFTYNTYEVTEELTKKLEEGTLISRNIKTYEVFEGCGRFDWGCSGDTDVYLLNEKIEGATHWNLSCVDRWEIISTSSIANLPLSINDTGLFDGFEMWTNNRTEIYHVYNCSYGDTVYYVVANETDQLNWERVEATITGNNPETVWSSMDAPFVWHMTESSNRVLDSSGDKDLDETQEISYNNTDGIFGYSAQFNGSTVALHNMTMDGSIGNNPFTMMIFAQSWGLVPNWGRIMDFGCDGNYLTHIISEYGGGGTFGFGMYGNNQDSGVSIELGRWFCLAQVYNGTDVMGFINGTRVTIATMTPNLPATVSIRIGSQVATACGGGSASPWNGTLDEARIYDRALTTAEIQDYCNNGFDNLVTLGPKETYDATPPGVNMTPPDNTTYTSLPIEFNVTLNEIGDTCLFEYDGTNHTAENTTGNYNHTNGTMPNGVYPVIAHCNDTTGNLNSTESITFTVSVPLPPTISYEGFAGLTKDGIIVRTNCEWSNTTDYCSTGTMSGYNSTRGILCCLLIGI